MVMKTKMRPQGVCTLRKSNEQKVKTTIFSTCMSLLRVDPLFVSLGPRWAGGEGKKTQKTLDQLSVRRSTNT